MCRNKGKREKGYTTTNFTNPPIENRKNRKQAAARARRVMQSHRLPTKLELKLVEKKEKGDYRVGSSV